MKQELISAIEQVVRQHFPDAAELLFASSDSIELSRPDEKFGDYATNLALQLAGRLGRPPREVAEELAAALRGALAETAQEVSVAGPGFINLRLSAAALARAAAAEPPRSLQGKTIVVEYSDPNPFKPLHAGHLYTTLAGDTIARLAEHAGAKVIRINYGGDVGLHVAKSMWSIVRNLGGELPEKLADTPESERPAWLGVRYVEGNLAYESDEAAKQEIVAINKRVYELQAAVDHDSPFAQIYWTCRQWSYDYFASLYRELQVVPFDRYIPESEVTQLGIDTVRNQMQHGIFTKSDGAVVFDGEAEGLHTRVFINSAGLPTYETKDVGLSLTKWQDYQFDQSIIITDFSQQQYMQVVLAAIGRFAPEPAARTRHLTHGRVKLAGGVKISSRKGNGPSALDIIEAARQAGRESGTDPSEDTVLAAVKYAFTKVRIGGDIIYDPKESVALEGNSGPYLQYAHARACSIIAKAAASSGKPVATAELPTVVSQGLEPAERSLLRKIAEYPETVDKAATELLPHYICTHLYELAQAFNVFYEHNRVIGSSDRETLRLALVARYAATLRAGLELLGISAPERM